MTPDAAGFDEIVRLISGQIDYLKTLKNEDFFYFKASEFGTSLEEWRQTMEAKGLLEDETSWNVEKRVCQSLADRLRSKTGHADQTSLTNTLQVYTMRRRTYGCTNGSAWRGKRIKSKQAEFKSKLITAYGSRDTPARPEFYLYCPVLSAWIDESAMRATHIFPYAAGQKVMHTIFGIHHRDELNETENGLMVHKEVERMLALGFIALCPDIRNLRDGKQVAKWQAQSPKSYKIKVISPEGEGMRELYPGQGEESCNTWIELDNKRVDFRTAHRPRSRYLYWNYCSAILRRGWDSKGGAIDRYWRSQFGKGHWGTQGRFMNKAMLLAFVEELGREFNALKECAFDRATGTGGSDPTALVIACRAIRESNRRRDPDEDHDFAIEEEDEEETDDDNVIENDHSDVSEYREMTESEVRHLNEFNRPTEWDDPFHIPGSRAHDWS